MLRNLTSGGLPRTLYLYTAENVSRIPSPANRKSFLTITKIGKRKTNFYENSIESLKVFFFRDQPSPLPSPLSTLPFFHQASVQSHRDWVLKHECYRAAPRAYNEDSQGRAHRIIWYCVCVHTSNWISTAQTEQEEFDEQSYLESMNWTSWAQLPQNCFIALSKVLLESFIIIKSYRPMSPPQVSWSWFWN